MVVYALLREHYKSVPNSRVYLVARVLRYAVGGAASRVAFGFVPLIGGSEQRTMPRGRPHPITLATVSFIYARAVGNV